MNAAINALFFSVQANSDNSSTSSLISDSGKGLFSEALKKIMGVEEEGLSLETEGTANLLPLLLPIMLNQQEETEGLLLDEGVWSEVLLPVIHHWIEHPEQLEPFLGNEAFQQWFEQATSLLAAIGLTETTADNSTGTPVSAGSEPQGKESAAETLRVTLQQFIAAADKQPDSELISQLKEKLAALLIAVQAGAKGERNPGQVASSVSEGQDVELPAVSLTGKGEGAKPADNSSNLSSQRAGADPSLASQGWKWESPLKTDSAMRLEALAYKSGAADRVYIAESTASTTPKTAAQDNAISTPGTTVDNGWKHEAVRISTQPVQAPVQNQTMERFAGDMNRFVLRSFSSGTANGVSEAKLSLYPEHLGHVDVKITLNNGQLTAQLTAHTLLGKEMLDAQLAQLRANLQNQGIQVDRLDVTHAGTFNSHAFQEQRERTFQQQSGRSPMASESFEEDLSVNEISGLHKEVYGNEFNATV